MNRLLLLFAILLTIPFAGFSQSSPPCTCVSSPEGAMNNDISPKWYYLEYTYNQPMPSTGKLTHVFTIKNTTEAKLTMQTKEGNVLLAGKIVGTASTTTNTILPNETAQITVQITANEYASLLNKDFASANLLIQKENGGTCALSMKVHFK